ncbi:regulator of G-protein signaling 5-like isoform 2-T2 [Aulostomus maculatus]
MLAPADDVLAWGESLDHLLLCQTGQLVFKDFLRTEYSEENLLFWLACEDYVKITSETDMKVAANRIYTEFVQVDAPRQNAPSEGVGSRWPITKTQRSRAAHVTQQELWPCSNNLQCLGWNQDLWGSSSPFKEVKSSEHNG